MMSYYALENETRADKEIRLAAEYADYQIDTPNPISFVNWLSSKKAHERLAKGLYATNRREGHRRKESVDVEKDARQSDRRKA
jgi:hypothetical protein